MRSDSGSADGRLVAGGITLAIVVVAAFIAALIVSGVLSGGSSGADGIAIAGDSQTLEPDPDADTAADDAVTESQSPEPSPTSTSSSSAMFALGDTGDGVRELQARLRQIQWYETDVTGEFDEITVEAVRGFQARRDIEPTGEVDEETWDSLLTMTETPTEDEMYNRLEPGPAILAPGDEGGEVSELQARLKQIGWFDHEVTGIYGAITTAAVEGFQTKRGVAATGEVDQNTWDLLVNMTRDPTDAEAAASEPSDAGATASASPPESPATPSGLPEECSTGRVLCIDKSEAVLRWVVDGEVRQTVAVQFGSETPGDRSYSVDFKCAEDSRWGWCDHVRYALFFGWGESVHYAAEVTDDGVTVGDEEAMARLHSAVEVDDTLYAYSS